MSDKPHIVKPGKRTPEQLRSLLNMSARNRTFVDRRAKSRKFAARKRVDDYDS